MIFTISFLAGPAKVHQKLFAGVRQHCGCLREKFLNSGMLCVSSVVLLSSGQYSLECDLQKLGVICMIYGQPAFERTESNTLIAMHIALNQNRPQIRSGKVRACKRNHRGNTNAFFLVIFSGLQHILASSTSLQVLAGANRQWPKIYDLCHTFLHVARVKKPTAMRESRAILAWQ